VHQALGQDALFVMTVKAEVSIEWPMNEGKSECVE
jgi:hypothetical protein